MTEPVTGLGWWARRRRRKAIRRESGLLGRWFWWTAYGEVEHSLRACEATPEVFIAYQIAHRAKWPSSYGKATDEELGYLLRVALSRGYVPVNKDVA